jgi:rare lipoprotein A
MGQMSFGIFSRRIQISGKFKNGKSVIVRVNDRGPFVRGRIVDISRAAFRRIASLEDGVIDVTVETIE